MNCVRCGSENIRKNGIKKDGRQRYKCKDCGREFVESPLRATRVTKKEVVCIRCESKNIIKDGKTDEGKQRYICKDCGLISVMDKRTTTIFNSDKIPEGISCPACGGTSLSRSGFSVQGKQQYKCRSCGRKFIETPPLKLPLTAEEKKVIVFYHFNFGVRIKDLAQHLHRPHSTISGFIKKYKERKSSSCTSIKQ